MRSPCPQRLPSSPHPICDRCLSKSLRRPLFNRVISTNSNSNGSRSTLSQKTAEYIDTLQLRALAAGQKLNDFTGYSSIESLKKQIQKQGLCQLYEGTNGRRESQGREEGGARSKACLFRRRDETC